MVGKSFPSLAGPIFPRRNPRKLAALVLGVVLLAGCGGGAGSSSSQVQHLAGDGFAFDAPHDWTVSRSVRSIGARRGSDLVSVTIFRLARPVTPALRAEAVAELDRVAAELAKREGGQVEHARDERIANRDVRTYDIAKNGADERIGFVLVGRREYQLYCRRTGSPCRQLFASFRLAR